MLAASFEGWIELRVIHQMTIHPPNPTARCKRCYLSGHRSLSGALVTIQLKIKLFAGMMHIEMKPGGGNQIPPLCNI